MTDGSTFTQLVQTVVDSTIASLGEGGRLWLFGGAAVLNVPGTHIMGVDLPKVPKRLHGHPSTNTAARKKDSKPHRKTNQLPGRGAFL